jgi:hypothetical protein
MLSDNINLIDLRHQNQISGDFDLARQPEDVNQLSRDAMLNLQNANLMDLQMVSSTKLNPAPYKRPKNDLNQGKKRDMEVKIEGQTISLLSDPRSYEEMQTKPRKQKKARVPDDMRLLY